MTPLELMKASAASSNKAMHRATAAGQKRRFQPAVNGRTEAVRMRHTAVRALMERGISQQEIADRLGVNVSTIKGDILSIKAEDAHAKS